MKKIVSVLLAVLLVIGAAPVQVVAAPAMEPSAAEAAQPAAETETPVSPRATGEWLTVPGIEGGKIRFDSSTGTITDCEETVTVANIPSTINGVAVKNLGGDSFAYCANITNVTIPNSVTAIGDLAFWNCQNLISIVIPSGVTRIGSSAFSYCDSLPEITIPDTVSSIGCPPFQGCKNLNSISVESGNSVYASKDGVLFDKKFEELIAYPNKKGGKYVVPNGVLKISFCAFSDCINLISAKMPNSLTSIGSNAFSGCSSLTNFEIPDSVTSLGDSAFEGCKSLKKVIIPDSITSMMWSSDVFKNCPMLTTAGPLGGDYNVQFGWTRVIPEWAFYNFTSLTTITIPNTITVIDTSAFHGCSNLVAVDIPNSVTNIQTGAFDSCINLESVTIPNSVTDMGLGVFENCNKLIDAGPIGGDYSIQFDWNTQIPDGAFYGCDSLVSVTIPEGIKKLGWEVFENCKNLTNIKIPDSVTAIGDSAFRGATGLRQITIPSNVTYIDVQAFSGCSNLKEVFFKGNAPGLASWRGEVFENCHQDFRIYYNPKTTGWATPEWKGYPCYPLPIGIDVPKGKYRFRVTDQNGLPLHGAKVTYDTQSSTTDNDGLVTFDYLEVGIPKITVILEGYDSCTNEKSNWQASESRYETIVLYPKGMGKYKLAECRYSNSANFSDHNTNLLTSTKKVALKNTGNLIGDLDFGNFYLSCKSYSPDETEKYQLWQGEKMVAESANGQFSLSVEQFTKGGGCKVCVLSKDGKQVDTPINLEFAENKVNKSSGISLMKKGLGITVADDVPFLGGSTFNVGMQDLLPVEIRGTDEKWYFGFNAKIWPNDDKSQTQGKFEEFKESLEKVKKANAALGNRGSDLMNSLISMEPDFDLPGGKVKVKIIGYAEAEWGSTVATGEIYIQFKATTPTFGFTTWVVVVPVTVQISGYIEAQAGVKTKIDLSNFTFSDTEFPLNITLGLNAFGGVGVGQVVGVGAYGDADVKFEMQLFLNQFLRAIDLTGELGLKAYVGPFEYSRAFAHHTWNLYKANNVNALSLNSVAGKTDGGGDSMFDVASYKPQDLSYLAEESAWNGGTTLRRMTVRSAQAKTELKSLLTDTYRNAQPTMIATENGIYAAFLRADQATENVYAVVTKYNGSTWAEPVRVDNTAVLDGTPSLCVDNSSNIWLAYAKTAPGYDKNSLSDCAKKQSIVVGKIDPSTLAFTKIKEYTGAGYAHLQTLAMVNGILTLAWVDSAVTDDNSVLWPQNNTLKVAQCTAGTWGTAQTLTTEPKCVSQLVLGEKNGALAVAYTVDKDNDYNTTEDQDLYCWANSAASLLAENVQGKVKFAKLPGQIHADFLWNQDGALKTAGGVTVEAAGITSEYAVTGDRIYYSAAGESGAQLTTVCYENGAWSAPVTITGGERYLENLSAATWNGNDFVMGMDTLATITTDNVEDAKNLVWAAIQPVSNLKLEEITYEAEGLTAGKETPVTLWVTNAGDHEVTSIDITHNGTTQTRACQLQPGETGQFAMNLTCPSTVTEYSLTVTETGKEDYTPADNTAKVSMGYADVAVELSEQRIGTDWSLVAVVTNNGVAPASGSISFTNGTSESVGENYFENVEPGAAVIATKKISAPGDYTASLTCEGDDLYSYNNSDTINVQRSTEIQLVEQQEDGIHATIYTEQPATAYCAIYSDSGKMLGIQQAALSAGIDEQIFMFNNSAAKRVKVFLLDENQKPLVLAKEIEE